MKEDESGCGYYEGGLKRGGNGAIDDPGAMPSLLRLLRGRSALIMRRILAFGVRALM